MNTQKLSLDELSNVTGGWDVSQFNEEETAKFYAIRDQLEALKDAGTGTKEEADRLLNELLQFELEMAAKYGE